jgi:hypothetical protein
LLEFPKTIEINFEMLDKFAPSHNYPNPFNPSTTIKFALAETQTVKLFVYDLLGNEVAVPFNGTAEVGKIYEQEFNGKNVSSGIYFYQLKTENRVLNRKMLVLK